jgi:plasmid stabilization system protein ParE
MSYRVSILARARADFDAIIAGIAERSPEGAERSTARFEDALAKLEENPLTAGEREP